MAILKRAYFVTAVAGLLLVARLVASIVLELTLRLGKILRWIMLKLLRAEPKKKRAE